MYDSKIGVSGDNYMLLSGCEASCAAARRILAKVITLADAV